MLRSTELQHFLAINHGNPAKYAWFWATTLVGFILFFGSLYFLRLTLSIPSSGTVLPENSAYIYAPQDGRLLRIHAGVGDKIKAGQTLYSMEDLDLDLRLVELSRNYLQAESNLEILEIARLEIGIRPAQAEMLNAKERLARLDRIHELQRESIESLAMLSKEHLVTKDEFNRRQMDMMKTEMEKLETSILAKWGDSGLIELQAQRLDVQIKRLKEIVKLAGNEIEVLKKQKSLLSIVSPIDGDIVKMDARHEGMSLKKGDLLAKIALHDGNYKVAAMVGEKNIDLLQVGGKARMSSNVFDSMLEGYIYGKVKSITPDSASDSLSEPLYEVEIEIESMPYPLVLGSTVRVDFLIARENLFNLLLQRSGTRDQRGTAQQSEPPRSVSQ